MKYVVTFAAVLIVAAAVSAQAPTPAPGGYIIQHDAEIAKPEAGTHNGGGKTIGYSFFDKTPGLHFVFRKRKLLPGSGIGYHEQKEDEIYYVLSGRGVMTLDGTKVVVRAGTAILTRPGSSHGLQQAGPQPLVILIAYETK